MIMLHVYAVNVDLYVLYESIWTLFKSTAMMHHIFFKKADNKKHLVSETNSKVSKWAQINLQS